MFGRTGRRCIRVLSEHACGNAIVLTKKNAIFLKLFCEMLQSGVPRLICANNQGVKFMLTDACYERESKDWVCGAGGVFLDPDLPCRQFFSVEISGEQRFLLGENSKKQLIFEAETIAALIAFLLWSEKVLHKFSILFVDNEATKFSLIKGFADNVVVDIMAEIFCEHETSFQGFNWIARVPSFSNLAEAPSRNDCVALLAGGFVDRSIDAYVILSTICAAVELKLGERAAASSHIGKRSVQAERRRNK